MILHFFSKLFKWGFFMQVLESTRLESVRGPDLWCSFRTKEEKRGSQHSAETSSQEEEIKTTKKEEEEGLTLKKTKKFTNKISF
jgi:hypothetical protein